MEKEINIAAILKDKPGAKLWSPIVGVCALNHINSSSDINVTIEARIYYNGSAIYSMTFNSRGKYGGEFKDNTIERECMLFPSKQMRDWEKFAWKKGDVLATDINTYCIFDSWENGAYTQFRAKYICSISDCHFYSDEVKRTCNWTRVKENDIIEYYINIIERSKGGKLNLSTLEIEKQEFKDGDIVVVDYIEGVTFICICKKVEKDFMYCYAILNYYNKDLYLKTEKVNLVNKNPRLAKEDEKQQFFSDLEKKNKAWDAEKKAIVDLPKKCELKPFQKVLVRMRQNKVWQMAFFIEKCKDKSDSLYPYRAFNIEGVINDLYAQCIPYNEETKHLLGTTDDWKGGEE